MIKYPTLYLSVAGIYVPQLCARIGFKPKDCTNELIHYSSQNMHVIDLTSIGEHVPDVKPKRMTEVNIVHDDAKPKGMNKYTIVNYIIHKLSRKIKPKEKESANAKLNNKFAGKHLSECHQRPVIKYFKIAFCCIYVTLLIFDIVRLTLNLTGTLHNDNRFVYCLSSLTIRLFLLFLNVTSNYVNYNHFLPTFCAWLEYERKYCLKLDRKRYRKRARSLFGFGIFVNITVFCTVCIGIATSFEELTFQVWPLDITSTFGRCTAAVLYGSLSCIGSCTIFSVHIFRSTVMLLLISEFQHLHERLADILSDPLNHSQTEEEFDKVIEQLRVLIELTQKTFQMVKHTIAAAYMFTPVLLCLVLYDLAGGSMLWNQNLLTIYTVVIVLTMISSATKMCALLRAKVT